ncbi:MAG: hypothetical protein ABJA98_10710 [Acidobacteriota bacterium]
MRPGGRILLVEDNSLNQLVAKRLLEKRGHIVVVAANGRAALAILEDASCAGVRWRADGHPGERPVIPAAAVTAGSTRAEQYDAGVLHAFGVMKGADGPQVDAREVSFSELRVGMILADDVRMADGTVLLAARGSS